MTLAPCEPFEQLLARVNAGSLQITFIMGPPCGGTTAMEHWVYEAFAFDMNYNQPGLLERVPDGGSRDRQATLWGRVLEKVQQHEAAAQTAGRSLQRQPLRAVVKETSNVVMPHSEFPRWQALCKNTIIVVRNPPLQAESRISCILNRIEAGAMGKDLGIDGSIDPRTFTCHGHRLVRHGTDFGHLDFESEQGLWAQHYAHMKATHDYTDLDRGFVHFAALHPLFEEPAVHREICLMFARKYPGAGLDNNLIEQWVGTRLEHFGDLPEVHIQALFEWCMGWLEHECHMKHLAKATLSPWQNTPILIDFSHLQAQPEFYMAQLQQVLAAPPPQPSPTCLAEAGGVTDASSLSAANAHTEPEDRSTHGRAESRDRAGVFDVGSRGADWDAWFLSSCNWDKVAATADIRPPGKRPIVQSKFPPCIAGLLPSFVECYAESVCSAFTMPCEGKAMMKCIGVDAFQDVMNEIFTSTRQLDRVMSDSLRSKMRRVMVTGSAMVLEEALPESEEPSA